jgi:hypothetical protein
MDKIICEYCNREYKSLNSRSNHYKIKHKNEYIENKNQKIEQRLNCSKCNKKLCDRYSKYRHEKICNNKDEIKELQNSIKELTEKFNILLKKNNKNHQKQINKQIINNSINNTNNGIINNTTNIINVINFGEEDLSKILQINEILKIFTEYRQRSLEESIKAVHFNNERPEYKNIYITCMNDDFIYIYYDNKFIEVNAKETINKLIDNHCNYMVKTLEECKSDISPTDYENIKKFIHRMYFDNNEFKHSDFDEKFPTFRDYKIASVKLIILKNSNKVLK